MAVVSRCEAVARTGVLAAAAGLVLSGCASQIAALAPVGGDDVTAVRNAAIDVVTGRGLLVLSAPQCSTVASGFSCVGGTTDGLAIVVSAPADATTMTVTVGGRVLYDGSVQAVLDAAAQGAPIPSGAAAGGVTSR